MVNFTHLIVLKKSPWFIYAASEEDAISTASHYPPQEVVGVVHAPGGLAMKVAKQTIQLEEVEVLSITHAEDPVDKEVLEEVTKDEQTPEQRQLPAVPEDPKQVQGPTSTVTHVVPPVPKEPS